MNKPARKMTYGVVTLEEVGKAIGVTRERARQIEAKALKKLRKKFELAGYKFEDFVDFAPDYNVRDYFNSSNRRIQ